MYSVHSLDVDCGHHNYITLDVSHQLYSSKSQIIWNIWNCFYKTFWRTKFKTFKVLVYRFDKESYSNPNHIITCWKTFANLVTFNRYYDVKVAPSFQSFFLLSHLFLFILSNVIIFFLLYAVYNSGVLGQFVHACVRACDSMKLLTEWIERC